MRLDIRPRPAVEVEDEELFLSIIRQAFQQRRKTLLNSLGQFCTREELSAVLALAKVPEKARAEELGLEEYARIANHLRMRKDGR